MSFLCIFLTLCLSHSSLLYWPIFPLYVSPSVLHSSGKALAPAAEWSQGWSSSRGKLSCHSVWGRFRSLDEWRNTWIVLGPSVALKAITGSKKLWTGKKKKWSRSDCSEMHCRMDLAVKEDISFRESALTEVVNFSSLMPHSPQAHSVLTGQIAEVCQWTKRSGWKTSQIPWAGGRDCVFLWARRRKNGGLFMFWECFGEV